MRKSLNRSRRTLVLSEAYTLEERVVLSSVAPSIPAVIYSHNAALTKQSQRALPLDRTQGHTAIHEECRPIHRAAAPTVGRWSWLAGTIWYVPTSNLPAVLFNSATGTLAPVSDQTVYQITGYREGYFWGKTVTQLSSSSPTNSALVGSITPQGHVLLTFTQTSGSSSPSVTEGFGTMQRKYGQWTMENQMFNSMSASLQIGHWAYMVQTHPGLPSWYSLPEAGVSVPTFLSQYDGPVPQPVTS